MVGFRAAIFNIMGERISRNLRRDYFQNILNKDIEFFDKHRTGPLGKLNSSRFYQKPTKLQSNFCCMFDCSLSPKLGHLDNLGLFRFKPFYGCSSNLYSPNDAGFDGGLLLVSECNRILVYRSSWVYCKVLHERHQEYHYGHSEGKIDNEYYRRRVILKHTHSQSFQQ